MNRALISTTTFIRTAKRFLKKHPARVEAIRTTLSLMKTDVFQPKLRSHKLKGELEGRWACSFYRSGATTRSTDRFQKTVTAFEPDEE